MNVVDIVIVVLALAYAASGFRNGAIVGVLSLAGFLGGAVLGARVARPLSTHLASGHAQVVVAVVGVLLIALIGQVVGVAIGGWLRGRVRWRAGQAVDAVIGGLLGALSVVLVAWMVAVPLASSPFPSVASAVRRSAIVAAVDGAMPSQARSVYSSMRRFIDRSGFPPVFGDLQSTRVVDVPAPDNTLLQSPVVSSAHGSVFKVHADATQCQRASEGSSFVYAPGRLLTNAHVVAGASQVTVLTGDGALTARVVVYDPQRDVAVLAVDGLDGPALPFAAAPAATDDSAVVLGYPQDGPFDAEAARIRERGEINGLDIYGRAPVQREIYSIRSTVRAGNSGGPLLSTSGGVLGIVFASALDSPDTGFVLTDAEIAPDASTGRTATTPVSTGACD